MAVTELQKGVGLPTSPWPLAPGVYPPPPKLSRKAEEPLLTLCGDCCGTVWRTIGQQNRHLRGIVWGDMRRRSTKLANLSTHMNPNRWSRSHLKSVVVVQVQRNNVGKGVCVQADGPLSTRQPRPEILGPWPFRSLQGCFFPSYSAIKMSPRCKTWG